MAEKAKIIVFKNGAIDRQIPVMFNPGEYSVSADATVAGDGPGIQFKRVNVPDFLVTLFFDSYEDNAQPDVREKIKPIAELIMPTVEGKETKQPPLCLFSWGGFGYRGIVTKVTQRFTMFLATGIPVRAEVTVTFKAVIIKEEDAKFTGKEACRKIWTVKSGDRIDLIAYRALKDPALWPEIATLNRISDPLEFPREVDLGRQLIIPDLAG